MNHKHFDIIKFCPIVCALAIFCLSSCSKSTDIADGIQPDGPVSIAISGITVDGVEAIQVNDSTFYVRLPYGADTRSLPVVFDAESTVMAGGVTDPSTVDLSNPLILTSSHEEASREYTLIAHFSDLPVVYVNTSGPVLNKTDWVKKSSMRITNAGEYDALYSMSIRGRGNSTWAYPKKPYAIKLDEKAEVLGMPKHKRWCLLANWMDRTNIRNEVAFKIAETMTGLEWTPEGRFVDLVYNGEFVGNYYLCEQIKVDKRRVNIDELDPADIDEASVTGGYLMEFDEYYDEEYKFMTDKLKLPVNLKSPDEDVPEAQMNYIRAFVNEVEQKLAAKAPYSEIEPLIDIDSYIDYWLTYELVVCDEPNHPKSAYMYKKRDGKLYAGPVWDFDWGTFRNPARWVDRYSLWYRYLFNYKEFKTRLKERWTEHRPALGHIPEYIDTLQRALAESCDYDCYIWPLEGSIAVNGDESLSFAESVEMLKDNYIKRLDWMDVNIVKL